MKKRTILACVSVVFVLSYTQVFATHHTPEERGKTHFTNETFAGGNKSCNTCHLNGRGLAGAGAKTSFRIMGGEQKSLEEVINVCIVNANRGSAIDVNSVEMQEIVSYIRSLGPQKAPGDGQ